MTNYGYSEYNSDELEQEIKGIKRTLKKNLKRDLEYRDGFKEMLKQAEAEILKKYKRQVAILKGFKF